MTEFIKFNNNDVKSSKMAGCAFGYDNETVEVWYIEINSNFYPLHILRSNGAMETRAYLNDDAMTCHSTYINNAGAYQDCVVN